MTTHRHLDSVKKWTSAVTDPDLSPYALQSALASEASARAAADAALDARVTALAAAVKAIQTQPDNPASAPPVGSAFADSLANTEVGGPSLNAVSQRFRATGPQVVSIRGYNIGATHPGYGAGTGGTWTITVEEDDGTGLPSGRVVGGATEVHPPDDFPLVPLSASVTPGRLYHLVYRNTDPDPTANYSSVDDLFLRTPTSPRQPTLPDSDWATLVKSGSGPWAERPGFSPIIEVAYADGTRQGLGYMEVWVRSPQQVSGQRMARELFASPVTARGVTLRVVRVSGSSPLAVTLGDQAATIPASAVAVQPLYGQDGCSASRVNAVFQAPATGNEVRLSCPADTVYAVFAVRKGTHYGLSCVPAAKGQVSADGGLTWGPFTQDGAGPLDEGDLQFGLVP